MVPYQIDGRGIVRFLRYGSIGVSTFALDLALLFILTEVFAINYILASGVAFFFAVSLNYVVSRRMVFSETKRKALRGYVNFLLFAGMGMFLTMLGMYVLVSMYAFHYIAARILIAGFVGVWGYLLNLYINFKVAGEH